ncbi:permease-like cell division protein FtsX [Asanoa ishikariensis]|uniref:permease-like cell division protein FtsX n=1 Tax=Asanoa ishikariensis TaxID=137265 RepID=UPI000B874D41|nr:permease-like cell division protein FtsX [Asanoa ishikariensis]
MRRYLATLVALTLSATALSSCSGDEADPLPVRVVAMIEDDAAADPSPVEEHIRALPGVGEVSFRSKADSFADLKKSLADTPEALAGGTADNTPATVSAKVKEPALAEALELAIGTFDGVLDTTLGPDDRDVDTLATIGVVVRLAETSTAEQRAAIERAIRALPRVEDLSFETAEQTRDRLRDRCRDRGELTTAFDRVAVRDIAASFRFIVKSGDESMAPLSAVMKLEGFGTMRFVPSEVVTA